MVMCPFAVRVLSKVPVRFILYAEDEDFDIYRQDAKGANVKLLALEKCLKALKTGNTLMSTSIRPDAGKPAGF